MVMRMLTIVNTCHVPVLLRHTTQWPMPMIQHFGAETINDIHCKFHVQIWRMRKQWIPGPFLSPCEKGLGTRLGSSRQLYNFNSTCPIELVCY